ncbi:hypothetical protein [Methanoregula sp.]
MPNFDGNGPLKRGRVIGRGRGPCTPGDTGCGRRILNEESSEKNEKRTE